jgi:restriction system protein
MIYFILSIILISLLFLFKKKGKRVKRSRKIRKNNSKDWRINSAYKTLEKIKKIDNNAQRFSYLRKVDPFVFEEMILNSLSSIENVTIQRNKRYTGDGGFDGTFYYENNGVVQKILIQAKRYSSHINPQHIKEFCEVVKKENADFGIFVHTGKTGKNVWKNVCEKVFIYSGEKMLNLLLKNKL